MKRLVLILVTLALSLAAKSQVNSSIMMLYSPFNDKGLIASESYKVGNNHVGYAYIEMGDWRGRSFGAYGQFFWEQKFWDSPFYLHWEYRANAASSYFESATYLGAAYTINSKHGFLSIEPLFMWKEYNGLGGQLSIVGGWEWKYFQIETFNDLWTTHLSSAPAEFNSQTRFFLKITPKFALGIIGTLYYDFTNRAVADGMLTLRWRM